MGKYAKLILLLTMLAVCSACFISVTKHNEDSAAISAVEFAKAAFVERNAEKAYNLLAEKSQAYYSKEKITEVLANMNSPTSPTVITATEFEPIAGQEMMNIFLAGENGSEKFYYRLEMTGTEQKGYKVSGFFRAQGQYPISQSRRPLPVKRSTSG